MSRGDFLNIGTKIKNRRKELGLTMLQVANQTGVCEATVSRWESGDIANMRRDKIVSLAAALRVPPSYIMDYDDSQTTFAKKHSLFAITDTEEHVLSSFRKLDADDQKYVVKTIDMVADRYKDTDYDVAAFKKHKHINIEDNE